MGDDRLDSTGWVWLSVPLMIEECLPRDAVNDRQNADCVASVPEQLPDRFDDEIGPIDDADRAAGRRPYDAGADFPARLDPRAAIESAAGHRCIQSMDDDLSMFVALASTKVPTWLPRVGSNAMCPSRKSSSSLPST